MTAQFLRSVCILALAAILAASGAAQTQKKAVFLEDLTWMEAEKALKDYDVALIALGARTK